MREATIMAGVSDWFEFMNAYHDAVLGWVGGQDPTRPRCRTAST